MLYNCEVLTLPLDEAWPDLVNFCPRISKPTWDEPYALFICDDLRFTLSGFPGNCGIAVISELYHRDRKYIECLKIIEKFLTEVCGYSVILYSTAEHQFNLETTLAAMGYSKIDEGHNYRTRHTIALWSKHFEL